MRVSVRSIVRRIKPGALGRLAVALAVIGLLLGCQRQESIQQAARRGDLARVRKYLESGGAIEAREQNPPEDAEALQDHFAVQSGETMLHGAAEYDNLELVRWLLDHGADSGARNDAGETPLHLAAAYGHREVAALLVGRGAAVQAADRDGNTPLLLAARNRHAELLRWLIAHGAKVNARNRFGWTPLHQAALFTIKQPESLETLKVLLDAGADLEAKDNAGRTPLHHAALFGKMEIAGRLLEQGASVAARDSQGATPLHLAALNQNLEVARLLLAGKAEINARMNNGKTPLGCARHRSPLNIPAASGGQAREDPALSARIEQVGATEMERFLRQQGGVE